MERKERIRILHEIATSIELTAMGVQALSSSIAEAELLERVSGGVEKSKSEDHICDKEWRSQTNPEPCIACIKDNIIDFCNAHWVEKMKGIEDFITSKFGKELHSDFRKEFAQALINYLTGGIE